MSALHRTWGSALLGAALALGLLFTPDAGRAAAREKPENKVILSFPTSALGVQHLYPGAFVFTKESEWTNFWRKYGRGTAPSVDFSHWQILAIFLGRQPNPGYSVEITNYTVKGSEITVDFVRSLPVPGVMYIQKIVYPYDIVAIPARGRVVYRVSTHLPPSPAAVPVRVRLLAAPALRAKAPLQYNVFTSAQAWREFWTKYETGPVPRVDFAKDIVVAIVYPPGYITPSIGTATRRGNQMSLELVRGAPRKAGEGKNIQRPTFAVVPRALRIDLTVQPRPAPHAPGPPR